MRSVTAFSLTHTRIFRKGLRELEQSTLDLTPDLQIAIEAIKTIDNDCRARCISIGDRSIVLCTTADENLMRLPITDGLLQRMMGCCHRVSLVPDNTASVEKPVQVAPESQTRLNSESESCAELGTASRHLDVD